MESYFWLPPARRACESWRVVMTTASIDGSRSTASASVALAANPNFRAAWVPLTPAGGEFSVALGRSGTLFGTRRVLERREVEYRTEDGRNRDRLITRVEVVLTNRGAAPAEAFVRMYFLKAGFLDGVPGLVIAVTGAYYVFLKYAKLQELQRDRE